MSVKKVNAYSLRKQISAAADTRTWVTWLVTGAGFALYILHLWVTRPLTYTHDIGSHMNYIRYIAEHSSIPGQDLNWRFYHPPLYYILAACVWNLSGALGAADPLFGVCFLSLAFYLGYVYFAAKLLADNVHSYMVYGMALAVLVFWPLGVNMARMVSNDVAVLMAQTAGLYYLLRWWKEGRAPDMLKSLLCNALAMHFKSSALLFGVTVMVIVLLAWKRNATIFRPFSRGYTPALLAVLMLVTALPLARNYHYQMQSGQLQSGTQSPIFFIPVDAPKPVQPPPSGTAQLDNLPYHFLSFDLHAYLTYPFYDLWRDYGGRQYFWNSVLKTSLFDEFLWKDESGALKLSILELLMLGYVWASILLAVWVRADDDSVGLFCLMGIGIQLAGLLMFRLVYPFSFHQEYRFIYVVTPLFCVLYAKSVEWHFNRCYRAAGVLGWGLGAAFALKSVEFMLYQDWQ